ncbi:hypothetical protein LX36DRAFT_106424 [Colletotrichum falcatum]|nr:hypothetical protein LX36DRAFT_106424 [Colletotrichum falcatum]
MAGPARRARTISLSDVLGWAAECRRRGMCLLILGSLVRAFPHNDTPQAGGVGDWARGLAGCWDAAMPKPRRSRVRVRLTDLSVLDARPPVVSCGLMFRRAHGKVNKSEIVGWRG